MGARKRTLQAHHLYCGSYDQAVAKNHYGCFTHLLPGSTELYPVFYPVFYSDQEGEKLFSSIVHAMRKGPESFADQLLRDHPRAAAYFTKRCVLDDGIMPISQKFRAEAANLLRSAIYAAPGVDREELVQLATDCHSVRCLSVLLESGAGWEPEYLLRAAKDNRLDILEVVLRHQDKDRTWCPKLPTQAALAGNLRFLMHIFGAGCPMWASAVDGGLRLGPDWGDNLGNLDAVGYYTPVGQGAPKPFVDWSLTVSNDLVSSGPSLLYAFQKGAPMTLRMKGMLADVRQRALALLCCFHRASSLARAPRAPEAHARLWQAMAAVPQDIFPSIATLAKISIFVDEFVT